MKNILKPETRAWIYDVCVAGFGVLGVYGIMDGQSIAAYSILAAAVCGLARGNVDYESHE